MHVDADPSVGGVSIDLGFFCNFDELSYMIANIFERKLIPIVLREGVQSDPDWWPIKFLFVKIEYFHPVSEEMSGRVEEVWSSIHDLNFFL